MSLSSLWLATELDGAVVVANAARTSSANSGDVPFSTVFGEAGVAVQAFGWLLDITAQGGTQASVDFDFEFKYGGDYIRMARYNSAPGEGAVARLILPDSGALPLPQGDIRFLPFPDDMRVVWTFNTAGATPTITFGVRGMGWGYRNSKTAWPEMRV